MACVFKKYKEELADVKHVSQVNCNVQIFFEVATNKVDRNHESWTRVCPVSHSEVLIVIFFLAVIFSISFSMLF